MAAPPALAFSTPVDGLQIAIQSTGIDHVAPQNRWEHRLVEFQCYVIVRNVSSRTVAFSREGLQIVLLDGAGVCLTESLKSFRPEGDDIARPSLQPLVVLGPGETLQMVEPGAWIRSQSLPAGLYQVEARLFSPMALPLAWRQLTGWSAELTASLVRHGVHPWQGDSMASKPVGLRLP